MPGVSAEVRRNFRAFSDNWWSEISTTKVSLDGADAVFLGSYQRLVSLNAWRALIETIESRDSVEFFLEAQNDALLSHIQARLGSWRLSLQCLRSALENLLFFTFYKDHPIELELWSRGRHRLTAREMFDYLGHHPKIDGFPESLSGLEQLTGEYAVLSRAVHASAKSFRMAGGPDLPRLSLPDRPRLGMWGTREKRTILGMNLVLLVLYRERLAGTAQRGIREVLGAVVPAGRHGEVRRKLGVHLTT